MALGLRYRDEQYAILQFSRGMGHRALEVWFRGRRDQVWPDNAETNVVSDVQRQTKQKMIHILSIFIAVLNSVGERKHSAAPRLTRTR